MDTKTPVDDFRDLIEAEETKSTTTVQKEPESSLKASAMVEAFDTTITALAPTAIEREILENSVQGLSVAASAYKIGIPESYIRTYLRNPKVKAYLKEIKEAINEIDQMMITGTLRKIVEARIEGAVGEDGNIDFASLSSKDTLDVIKVFSDITNQIAKGQVQEKSDDVFVNIYQQILQKD